MSAGKWQIKTGEDILKDICSIKKEIEMQTEQKIGENIQDQLTLQLVQYGQTYPMPRFDQDTTRLTKYDVKFAKKAAKAIPLQSGYYELCLMLKGKVIDHTVEQKG